MTLLDFILDHHIAMTATPADHNPSMGDDAWARTALHWSCRLRRGRRSVTFSFSQGSAHTSPPTAADVLGSVASDSAGLDNAHTFEEWASEYRYDADSRRAEKTYRAVERNAEKPTAFLGPKLYQELLYEVERL